MGKANFSDDFKRGVIRQNTERGYPVTEVSERLGVSTHSLTIDIQLCPNRASALPYY